jgi:quinolinate synthase
MITPRELLEAKKKHPRAVVVCYINSSAGIKALSDICCTSANAASVVERIPAEKEILFIPDCNLGKWVSRRTKREIILWPGHCPIHQRFLGSEIKRLKKRHPRALVMAHPECPEEVADLADAVLGTGGMIRLAREDTAREYIVATEAGLLHRLKKENPGKIFYPASLFGDCPDMKLINLEKILWSLKDMEYKVKVEEGVRKKAFCAVQKILPGS